MRIYLLMAKKTPRSLFAKDAKVDLLSQVKDPNYILGAISVEKVVPSTLSELIDWASSKNTVLYLALEVEIVSEEEIKIIAVADEKSKEYTLLEQPFKTFWPQDLSHYLESWIDKLQLKEPRIKGWIKTRAQEKASKTLCNADFLYEKNDYGQAMEIYKSFNLGESGYYRANLGLAKCNYSLAMKHSECEEKLRYFKNAVNSLNKFKEASPSIVVDPRVTNEVEQLRVNIIKVLTGTDKGCELWKQALITLKDWMLLEVTFKQREEIENLKKQNQRFTGQSPNFFSSGDTQSYGSSF